MCYHSIKEMRAAMGRLRKRATHAFIIMRNPETSEFEEAYHCDATDIQEIANTIRNLRAWHPGDHVVDLTQVNEVRGKFKLESLVEQMLPAPTGVAPPSEDPNVSVDDEERIEATQFENFNSRVTVYFDDVSEITPTVYQEIAIISYEYRWTDADYAAMEMKLRTSTDRYLDALVRNALQDDAWKRYAPFSDSMIQELKLWTPPEPKRRFAKSDNWLERFMQEHKFVELAEAA